MTQLKTLLRDYWLVAVIGLAVAGFFWWQNQQPEALAPIAESSATTMMTTTTSSEATSTPKAGFVHIKGAVVKPGLYPVDGTTRWDDVVKAAGGLTPEADVSGVNLALFATDEASLWIPAKGEAPTATTGTTPGAPAASGGSLVNINTADITVLQTLSGIGPKKAADIVAYREANGNFATIDDIQQVSGIGEKTFEALKDAITVGP